MACKPQGLHVQLPPAAPTTPDIQDPALTPLGSYELSGCLQKGLGLSVSLPFLGILAEKNQGDYRLSPHGPDSWEIFDTTKG